jgi:hypothetical protein
MCRSHSATKYPFYEQYPGVSRHLPFLCTIACFFASSELVLVCATCSAQIISGILSRTGVEFSSINQGKKFTSDFHLCDTKTAQSPPATHSCSPIPHQSSSKRQWWTPPHPPPSTLRGPIGLSVCKSLLINAEVPWSR